MMVKTAVIITKLLIKTTAKELALRRMAVAHHNEQHKMAAANEKLKQEVRMLRHHIAQMEDVRKMSCLCTFDQAGNILTWCDFHRDAMEVK